MKLLKMLVERWQLFLWKWAAKREFKKIKKTQENQLHVQEEALKFMERFKPEDRILFKQSFMFDYHFEKHKKRLLNQEATK